MDNPTIWYVQVEMGQTFQLVAFRTEGNARDFAYILDGMGMKDNYVQSAVIMPDSYILDDSDIWVVECEYGRTWTSRVFDSEYRATDYMDRLPQNGHSRSYVTKGKFYNK